MRAPRRCCSAAARCSPLAALRAAAPACSRGPACRSRFPRDFGAHPDFRIEWWYVTGWLAAPRRSRARSASRSPSSARAPTCRPTTRAASPRSQLLFAHAALTDLGARRLRHDQRIARAGFGIAEAAEADTDVRAARLALRAQRPADGQPLPRPRRRSDAPASRFDLRLAATQPVLLQGEAGFSRKGPRPGAGEPLLQRAAARRQRHADARRPAARRCSGRAWLDHEWSESLLAPDAVGWDWIGMNLRRRQRAHRLPPAPRRRQRAVGRRQPAPRRAARLRAFGPDEVRFTPGARWTSPASQRALPGRVARRHAGRPLQRARPARRPGTRQPRAAPARSTGRA